MHEVTQLAPGVRLLTGSPFECCIYLVEGNQRALVVDTGAGEGNLRQEVEQLTSLPYDVVLTHGHSDHAGGSCWFDEVHMSPGAVADANDSVAMNEGKIERQWWLDSKRAWEEHPCHQVPVADGQVFDLGGRALEVIEVPGHTPGCIALLDGANRTLYCGDCLVQAMDILMAVPSALPLGTYLASMRKLQQRGGEFDWLRTGHDAQALPASFLDQAIACASDIIDGTLVGERIELDPAFGDVVALHAERGPVGMLYRPDNL